MNRDEKTLLTSFAAGSVVILLMILLMIAWPTWSWLFLTLGLLAITALIGRQIRGQREQEQPRALRDNTEATHREPATPAEHHVSNAALPSAEADYRFLFSATVHWYPIPDRNGISHDAHHGIAVDSILSRAGRLSSTQPPADHVHAQYKLAADLGIQRPDPSRQLVAWADTITLTLSDDDTDRLTKLADLRKQQAVWDHERGSERSMRAYLGEEVLESPGSAVVWWLARHTDDVHTTVRLIGDFAQLVAAANNTDIDERFQRFLPAPEPADPTSGDLPEGPQASPAHRNGTDPTSSNGAQPSPEAIFADDLFPHPEEQGQRSMFLDDLAKVADAHGKHSQADRIRSTLDLPSLFVVPDSPAENDPGTTINDTADTHNPPTTTVGPTVDEPD